MTFEVTLLAFVELVGLVALVALVALVELNKAAVDLMTRLFSGLILFVITRGVKNAVEMTARACREICWWCHTT